MVSRRRFLAGAAATAALAACSGDDDGGNGSGPNAAPGTDEASPPPVAAAEPVAVAIALAPFTLGVASGDPDAASVVLWTRLAPDPLVPGAGLPDGDVEVAWDVAADDGFEPLVASGTATAAAGLGHSVHVTVDGLDAGTDYAYRFRVGGHTSAAGRTRTAPAADDPAPLRLAVASCQRYDHGTFVAYRHLAVDAPDVVVFVGDYIYEYAADADGDDALRTLPGSPGEAVDLDGYRLRYAAARLDADLAAAHAAAPWVVLWDDHEVANNVAGADDDDAARARRAAAYQAWWEHQPVRLAPPTGPDYAIARSVRLGQLVELLVLDGRQHRDPQACGGDIGPTDECPAFADPARTMLGAEQEAWLVERLAASPTTWTMVAQPVVFTPIEVFGLVNPDAWDGYAAERDRIVAVLAAPDGPANPVILAGDIHAGLVAAVRDADDAIVATELVAPSISSRPAAALADAVGLLGLAVPDVAWASAERRGYLLVDVAPDAVQATYRFVADATDPASPVADGPTFELTAGAPGPRQIS